MVRGMSQAAAVMVVAIGCSVLLVRQPVPYLSAYELAMQAMSAEEIADRLNPYLRSDEQVNWLPPQTVEVCEGTEDGRVDVPDGTPRYGGRLPAYAGSQPVEVSFWILPNAAVAADYLARISAAGHSCPRVHDLSLGDTSGTGRISVSAYAKDGWSGARVVESGSARRSGGWGKPFTKVRTVVHRGFLVATIEWEAWGFAGRPRPWWRANGEHAADRVLRLVAGREDQPPPIAPSLVSPTTRLSRALPALDERFAALLAHTGARTWEQLCFDAGERERAASGIPQVTRRLSGASEVFEMVASFTDTSTAERYRKSLIDVADSRRGRLRCPNAAEDGPQPDLIVRLGRSVHRPGDQRFIQGLCILAEGASWTCSTRTCTSSTSCPRSCAGSRWPRVRQGQAHRRPCPRSDEHP
jgi:hypothetical protein